MKHKIGTRGWFTGEAVYSKRGTVDCILDLLMQESISQDKARELLEFATCPFRRSRDPAPDAPWDELPVDTHMRDDLARYRNAASVAVMEARKTVSHDPRRP